jgi:hypothetical protein
LEEDAEWGGVLVDVGEGAGVLVVVGHGDGGGCENREACLAAPDDAR